jgi:hypothetical protein
MKSKDAPHILAVYLSLILVALIAIGVAIFIVLAVWKW